MKRLAFCIAATTTLVCLALVCDVTTGARKPQATQPKQTPPKQTQPPRPTSDYEKIDLRGWTLRVNEDLLDANQAELWEQVRAELDNQLYRITRVIPAEALEKLRKIVIWVELANPQGGGCCYHPSAKWLKEHNYNLDKENGFEIRNAKGFLRSVKHQPWLVLHELSHGYHDEVLSFRHPKILALYAEAKKSGKYDKVLVWNGKQERAYHMSTPMEYFSETTEAYFGQNDVYPFVKVELRRHDPNMYSLLEELWGIPQTRRSRRR